MFFMYWSWFRWLCNKYSVMNYVRNWDLLESDEDDDIVVLNVCNKWVRYYYGIE